MRGLLVILLLLLGCGTEGPWNGCAPGVCIGSKLGAHSVMYPGFTPAQKAQLTLASSTLHVGWMRFDLNWPDVQASEGAPFDWTAFDTSINAVAAYPQLRMLPTLMDVPQWASSAPADPNWRQFPPAADKWGAWQVYIAALVNRYGAAGTGQIHTWEVWGEANLQDQFKGTAAEYAHLYAVAYDTIKASDPTATVLMAGMTQHNQPTWVGLVVDDPTYPARSRLDAIDIHTRGSVAFVKALVTAWRDVFAQNGLPGLPVYITEFGFPSNRVYQPLWDPNFVGANVSDALVKQGQYYDAIIPWLMTTGAVTALFVTLRDLPVANSGFASEGVCDQTCIFQKHPGWDVVAHYAELYHQ